MICRDICSVFNKRLEFDNRPAFGAVDMDPNRSLDTPCPFLIGEMRLSGILPASVRILFLAMSVSDWGNEAFGHLARFCPHPVSRYASR